MVLCAVCCAMRAAAPLRCCDCFDHRLRLSHTHVGCDCPRRLIQSAIGGTVIEAWSPNQTTLECQNKTPGTATAGKPNGRLFYGMVCPFVNMSISGWTWYQVSARHPRCASSLCTHVFLHTRCHVIPIAALMRLAASSIETGELIRFSPVRYSKVFIELSLRS